MRIIRCIHLHEHCNSGGCRPLFDPVTGNLVAKIEALDVAGRAVVTEDPSLRLRRLEQIVRD
jgi:hypothetical protein